jgi:putative flippase GtrA
MIKNLFKKHQRKINYLLVGGWNTIFGYLVFVALYFLFHRQLHYMVIFIVSNIISITNAYIGFKFVVFKTKGNYLREYLRFYIVYGTTIALNLVLLPVLVEIFHISPVIAPAGLVFISALFSYIGNKKFSFKAAVVALLTVGVSLFLASASVGEEINLDQAYAWKALNPQTNITYTDGLLKIVSGGGFAGVYNQKMAAARLEDNSLLVFEMKTSSGGIGALFWANYLDQQFMPQRSYQFYLGKPNSWQRYYIDLGSHEKDLTRIDFVLINPLAGSGEAEVRDIKIIKGTVTDKLIAGWQEFLGVKGREVVGYTINTMPSVRLFGREIFIYIYWLVGLLAVALLAVELWPLWRRPEKKKTKGKEKSKFEPAFNRALKKLFIFVIAVWFVLELSSLYTDWLNLRNDLPLFGQELEQKRAMVNTGDFYPFIRFCEEKLPAGAAYDMRIPAMYNDVKAIYYLYPHENTTEADYLVVYDKEVEPDVRRVYEPFAVFRPNAFIMKRVGS